jgi:hypothetical protein
MPFRKNFLSDFYLKLSMFGEFNDPFELVPGNFGATLSDYERDVFYSHSMHAPANYIDYNYDIQCGVRATIGVICFTSEKDNLLMWAHYAQNHKGVCIEFDSAASFFNGQYKDSCKGLFGKETAVDSYKTIGEIKQVSYSKKRPLFIDPSEISDGTDFWFTKSEDWSYEKEYRILLPSEHAIEQEIGKMKYLFYKIDKKIIKSIILGCQMNKGLKDEIYSICLPLGIRVSEAFVNSLEYKLDIVDYHPENHQKHINMYNFVNITK